MTHFKSVATLVLAILAMSFATACSNDDTPQPAPVNPPATSHTYVGKYKALLPDGTLSMQGESQAMRLLKGRDTDTLYMDQIRFTPKVPMAFDIRFDGIVRQADGHTLSLDASTKTPQMMAKGQWTDMPQYAISAFEGRITADSLYLHFMCGPNRLEYAGRLSGK